MVSISSECIKMRYYQKRQCTITHSFTHGSEPFLRSCQVCSYSRTSQHFMEPEVSLLCSQEPSTGPYSEPDDTVHTILSYLSKIYFNIVHPPVTLFLTVSFLLMFPPISYMHSSSPQSCYVPYTSHPP
jgi:hypothetical protein